MLHMLTTITILAIPSVSRTPSSRRLLTHAFAIVDFDKYFDGESLEQEDLVVWFNLGMAHAPHTGDLPNTYVRKLSRASFALPRFAFRVFPTAQGSMQFLPHNYLERDPSRNVHHQVRIDYSNDGVSKVHKWGAEWPEGTMDLSKTNPNLYTYQGDVAVRKFPFDPANPFNDTESIV